MMVKIGRLNSGNNEMRLLIEFGKERRYVA